MAFLHEFKFESMNLLVNTVIDFAVTVRNSSYCEIKIKCIIFNNKFKFLKFYGMCMPKIKEMHFMCMIYYFYERKSISKAEKMLHDHFFKSFYRNFKFHSVHFLLLF